jgi:uncharacterized protein (DUF169 family)
MMESQIAQALKLAYQPVVTLWSNEKTEGAVQFEKGRWGCVMQMFAAAAKGKTVVFDRETFGCAGGGVGLGFGDQYAHFPGGTYGFCRFLSTGNEEWEQGRRIGVAMAAAGAPTEFCHHFLHGERFRKTPELVRHFLDRMPIMEVPAQYVVFKPLAAVDPAKERPVSITFLANPDQFSALVILASYDRAGGDNVIIPHVAACQLIGILTYREATAELPRAVAGLTDITARRFMQDQVGSDKLTFSVPFARFREMEDNVTGSFLEGDVWRELARTENDS